MVFPGISSTEFAFGNFHCQVNRYRCEECGYVERNDLLVFRDFLRVHEVCKFFNMYVGELIQLFIGLSGIVVVSSFDRVQ